MKVKLTDEEMVAKREELGELVMQHQVFSKLFKLIKAFQTLSMGLSSQSEDGRTSSEARRG